MTGRISLRQARDKFEALLARSAAEGEFQALFASHPEILSAALPLRLLPSDIHPQARPGRSDPDFIIFPERTSSYQTYGVIELKRPSSQILTEPRKGIIQLSRTAQTAVSQARVYGERLRPLIPPSEVVMLGNDLVYFVIIGLSRELAALAARGLYGEQVRGLLPYGCQLLPYDTIFQRFSDSVPPRLFTLMPSLAVPVQPELLIRLVENMAFRLPYFAVTAEAFDAWEDVERQTRLLGEESSPVLIDRRAFYVSGTTTLATETDNPQSFASAIVALIRRVIELARDRGIATTLDSFVGGAEHIGRLRRSGSEPDVSILCDMTRHAASDEFSQTSPDYFTFGDDIDRLRTIGCLQFVSYDSGEHYFLVHPLARYL